MCPDFRSYDFFMRLQFKLFDAIDWAVRAFNICYETFCLVEYFKWNHLILFAFVRRPFVDTEMKAPNFDIFRHLFRLLGLFVVCSFSRTSYSTSENKSQLT